VDEEQPVSGRRRKAGVADVDEAAVACHGLHRLGRVPRLRYVVADVFTDTPLAGSQLAVFTDARDLDEPTMQALALEMAFSETVFVLPSEAPDADVRIRIFTPASELPFAGHPVLGTAFVLARARGVDAVQLICPGATVALTFDERGRGRMH